MRVVNIGGAERLHYKLGVEDGWEAINVAAVGEKSTALPQL